jgi:hypothetical protein
MLRPLPMLTLAVSAFVFTSVCANAQAASPNSESWARENYKASIDRLLPGGFVDDSPREIEWVATVRILPTSGAETVLRSHTWPGNNNVEFVRAKGRTIPAQLQLLRQQHPNEPLNAIVARVETDRRRLNQAECSKLADSARDLETAKVAAVPPRVLMLDAVGYEF